MSQLPHELKPRILRFQIKEEDAGKTIREFLMKRIGFSSKQLSRFKYRKNGIMLNGVKRYVSFVLEEGDVLEIRLTQGGEPVENPGKGPGNPRGRGELSDRSGRPSEGSGEFFSGDAVKKSGYLPARDGRLQKIWVKPVPWLSQNHPLKILYEDEDILAVNKASGIVCHPSPGHFDDTLSNQVAEHLGRIGQELDIRVTGRLDKDTSGIVIFALNTETAAQLIKERRNAVLNKLYIARVRGHFSQICGCVDKPLRREGPESFRMMTAEDGKPARTHYCLLRQMEDGTSLVACRIEQGRTHQIRVHMASIGHPLVGDRLYGKESLESSESPESPESPESQESPRAEEPGGPGAPLMLHAFRAELVQPFSGEKICLEAPIPEWGKAASAYFHTSV